MFNLQKLFSRSAPPARKPNREYRYRPAFEALEERRLLSANNLVLYSAATINTYADVGFENNPVASLDAYFNGKQDRDATHFTAQINWGDNSGWQVGKVAENKTPGSRIPFVIKGSHTYDDAGNYSIQVRVVGDGMTLTKKTSAAAVNDMPLTSGVKVTEPAALGGPQKPGSTNLVLYSATQITATQGKDFSGTVALGDGYYNGPQDTNVADYKVQINWGDNGDWELGQVKKNAAGSRIPFALTGSHNYANTGTYQVVVQFTGPDGQTLSKQTTTVRVNADPAMPAPLLFKLSAATTDAQVQAMQLAEKLDRWADALQGAAMDAVKSFADGLGTDAKPDPISLTDTAKNPFSRSFFDAGRMLKGIAYGTQQLPGDLLAMAKNIVEHPEMLAPGYPTLAMHNAINEGLKDPIGTAIALYQGFEAFRDMDPAFAGGRSIPIQVLMGMFGPENPLAGKIGKAGKVFEATDAAKAIPEYGGMNPDLIPPTQVIPGGVKPMAAIINETRWANMLAKVNEGMASLGRNTNCPYTALVTDKILGGYSLKEIESGLMLRSAPPSTPKQLSWVEKFHPGRTFSSEMRGPALVGELSQAGHGARGIVYGMRYTVGPNGAITKQTGHFFNVVNNHGVITFYDGQTGKLASLGSFNGFKLLRTK